MRIEWAILCRTAEGHASALDLKGVGTNTFWIPRVPGPVAFYLVLQFAGEYEEFSNPHDVEVYLTGPETSDDLSFTLEPRRQAGSEDEVEVYEVQPLAIAFDAVAEGVYELDVYVNGERPKSVFFRIRTD